ncbi:ester cyclase [Aeromicrobium sp.]|uniref:ester cyclase n=1 Tax=Aeromicrobium sp. TaxID=1871063 RepID=UPI003D6B3034
MSTEEDKALLRRAQDEIYGEGRLDSIEDLLLDDVIAHEPDGDVRGVEEVKWYLAPYLAAFPDMSVTVEDVIAEGDKVVNRYRFRGTHTGTTEEYGPPTGKQLVIEGITLYHFKDGKVAEMWDSYDSLAVMQQLGLMSGAEPPSRASGLDRSFV